MAYPYDDDEPEDDGRPQLPRKLKYAGRRPEPTPEQLAVQRWARDEKSIIAERAAAHAEENRQRAGQVAANPWRTSVLEVTPGEQPRPDGLLDELRALGERSADEERAPAAQQQPSAEEQDRTGQFAATKMDPSRPR